TWAALRLGGVGGQNPNYFTWPNFTSSERNNATRGAVRLKTETQPRARPVRTDNGGTISGRPEHLVIAQQSRAAPIRLGGPFAKEWNPRTWLRFLRPVGFVGGKQLRFAHFGPRIKLSLNKHSKEAAIATGIVLAFFVVLAFVALTFTEYNSLKIEVSGLKKELGGTRERLAKLEANIGVALLSEKMKRTVDDR